MTCDYRGESILLLETALSCGGLIVHRAGQGDDASHEWRPMPDDCRMRAVLVAEALRTASPYARVPYPLGGRS